MNSAQTPKDFLRWLHKDNADPKAKAQIYADIDSMTDEQAANVVIAIKRQHFPDLKQGDVVERVKKQKGFTE